MATLSAPHLLLLSSPTSKSTHTHFTSHSLNPNPNPNPRIFSFNSSVPKLTPLPAVLRSSPITADPDSGDDDVTLRRICEPHVPDHILCRMEELGYVAPTLFSGRDCILHAQTGSGKTLTYLLLIFAVVETRRSAVQALIVVPTRELGMQVTRVSRMLAAKPKDGEVEQKGCSVMALLDGGMLTRHKSWLKAEPPTIVVATIGSLCHMLEEHIIKLESMRVLVIDEVDFMFGSKQVSSLRKLLTSYSPINSRHTVFASASIPKHRRFLHDCIQQKWTKSDAIHIHVNPVQPMPSCLHHRFVVSGKTEGMKPCYPYYSRMKCSLALFLSVSSPRS
ncbi:DEAD-box ATP-dependent RNA helicase 58, chloroplastic isoform X2 [Argentina anserina]|uniref:DEAD-box ATP-dependent RNA helicase 58, chloroplastic isoform X2 n=1 Tax=Argentina anserina TaxID=57926 RepID=UPI002176439C|nr:DEAD-box ATP-dependent RNA helicase 58, chloroplastic isoform X2 [Potentilla anserina]